MFSCCISTSRSTGPGNTGNKTFFHRHRQWLSPQPRTHWPLTSRLPKSSTRKDGKEECKGPCQCCIQCGNKLALKRAQNSQMHTDKAGPWEKLVEPLVPAVLEGDLAFLNIYLTNYQAFNSIKQVLDQLFIRYGDDGTFGEEAGVCQECLKKTISCVLCTWLERYPEDFFQPPDFPCLKQLVAFAQVTLPGSALENCAQVLLTQLESMELNPELQIPSMSPPEPFPSLVPDTMPTLELQAPLAPPPGLSPEAVSFLAPELEPVTSPALTSYSELTEAPMPPLLPPLDLRSMPALPSPQDPSCSSPETLEIGLSEVKSHFLTFPSKLVAEQLTVMDVDLFKKVVPYHCLSSIWFQCHKKVKEHLAPSVQATITQCNRVTNCVIATCLGDPSMKAPDRARVVEHWINVARECQILKNSSSLHAILSALQSNSMHCLKETWEEVSRDSTCEFQNMKNTSLSRDQLIQGSTSKDSTLEMKPEKAQQMQLQERSTVPYLGTFLKELAMLDSSLQDHLDERMIYYEKKRKEYQLLSQIQGLQSSCTYDYLVPDEQFRSWFGALEQLSETESHQGSSTKPSSRDTSHSSVQLQRGSDLGSGDAAASHPTYVAKTSNCDQKIHMGLGPESPDGQEKKFGESTPTPCLDLPGVTSASTNTSSSSASPMPGATLCTPSTSCSGPLYNKQVGDSCIIRISLDGFNGNNYKSILLTCQDRAPAVIRRAMEKHNLKDNPEDYKLVQLVSQDRKLRIPDDANVFYAMVSSGNYHFLLTKRNFPTGTNISKGARSTILRRKKKGLKFPKNKY